VRDNKEPVVRVRHMSEETPMRVLQVYGGTVGNRRCRLDEPIVLAMGGNCVFMPLAVGKKSNNIGN
jgi:hypothetical protein